MRRRGYAIPYSIEEATTRFELGNVISTHNTWVVTDYGLECLQTYYVIPKERINEPNWLDHVSEKSWCVRSEFRDALEAARMYHNRTRNRSKARGKMTKAKRFKIMKRDAFTCQLCGATANDGARLEIDHKHPLSRGGTNHESNLWTLCYECNRGKAAQSL